MNAPETCSARKGGRSLSSRCDGPSAGPRRACCGRRRRQARDSVLVDMSSRRASCTSCGAPMRGCGEERDMSDVFGPVALAHERAAAGRTADQGLVAACCVPTPRHTGLGCRNPTLGVDRTALYLGPSAARSRTGLPAWQQATGGPLNGGSGSTRSTVSHVGPPGGDGLRLFDQQAVVCSC
jgi:hypothetical protein